MRYPSIAGRKNSRHRPTRIEFLFAAPGQMNLRNTAVGESEQDVVSV
jgi:hypothetical protein